MIVCECCLEAIESHEGRQRKMKVNDSDHNIVFVSGYYNDDGEFIKEDEMDDDDMNTTEEFVFCEWCEEYFPVEDCYEI